MTEDIQTGIMAVLTLLVWLVSGYSVAYAMDVMLRRATRDRSVPPYVPLHGIRCVCDRCSRDP